MRSWETAIELARDHKVLGRIKSIGEELPGQWETIIAPTSGYIETGRVGPVAFRQVEWVDLQEPDLPVWIGCGNYAEHEDGFLCFINPSRPALFRLFAKADTRQAIARVADLLDSILADTPSVRDVKWWDGETPVSI